jgi:hypothetical protein
MELNLKAQAAQIPKGEGPLQLGFSCPECSFQLCVHPQHETKRAKMLQDGPEMPQKCSKKGQDAPKWGNMRSRKGVSVRGPFRNRFLCFEAVSSNKLDESSGKFERAQECSERAKCISCSFMHLFCFGRIRKNTYLALSHANLGDIFGHLERCWGLVDATLDQSGPFSAQLALFFGYLGSFFGQLGAVLGYLELSWAITGASLDQELPR